MKYTEYHVSTGPKPKMFSCTQQLKHMGKHFHQFSNNGIIISLVIIMPRIHMRKYENKKTHLETFDAENSMIIAS